MQNVINNILIVSALWLVAPGSTASEDDYLIFGIPNYPPYSVYEEQGFSGRDVELIDILAERMNIKIRFSPCAWIRCLMLAKSGRIDLLTSVNHAKEREAFLHFIEPAYSISHIVFVVRKDQADALDSINSLKSKIVGREKGARLFADVDDDPDIQKYESADIEVLFKMLVSGRLDAVMGGDVAMQTALQSSPHARLLAIAQYRAQVPSAYIAAARQSKRVEKHLNNLRAEMHKLQISGEILQFTHWQAPQQSGTN